MTTKTKTAPSENDIATGQGVAIDREVSETARLESVAATHTPTVAILSALDAAYAAIRATDPSVPSGVAIVVATGNGKKHGHFHASTWEDTNGTDKLGRRHEILMASESLARGAEATLTTLIHEAMHAKAHATGVKDTSRQGRFHNSEFRKLANDAGLLTDSDSAIGTVTTGLNSWALTHYAETLANLASVLVSYRIPEEKAKAPRTTLRIACECGVPVTVPIKFWNDFGVNALHCNQCDSEFFEA